MIGLLLPLAEDEPAIEIGHHVTREWNGWTFNIDTIASTLVAGGLVLLLGLLVKRHVTREPENYVPTKLQLIWEGVVGQVNKQVEDNLGRVHPYVAPLAISLFFFILFANWMELLPTKINDDTHLLVAPTADTNLTYALAAITMVSVWTYGIRQQGAGTYFKHFAQPFAILLPLNILEELIKPVTLALRLFGNIFAGGIMLALIAMIPMYALWLPNILWKSFDAVIGVIQAFIFALLAVLYFAMAGGGHGEHDDEHDAADADADADEKTPALAH
jgi:F-type H+-transporting ATPase subunit a